MHPESPPVPTQADLLPALHRMQAQFGYIPDQAVAELARTYNVSRAEVEGVIGFYHDFRRAPPGRRRLQVCCAESCQAMGADALTAHAQTRLGVGLGETAADGSVTLEAVYCLGNCACSPAVMLDGRVHGRVDAERLDALLAEGGEA
ncbi:MAG: formate dehydrogenase subunit gamma [Thiobacillus sp. 65-69]|nr:formate dehydrogenase subunit gamma [Thiobacillus sp.]ODU87525.1 MAG: formate dehydrogenase subunit gamma [Thiobacillus sp. SCN 65-179]OJW38726.1 MAG: formate dehydrogenase subunit gamma [Thiobacillus sp. 65-69]